MASTHVPSVSAALGSIPSSASFSASAESDSQLVSDAAWHAACDGPLPYAQRLERERDNEGGVEYKLHLAAPSHERFLGLATQVMWRLREGGGHALYWLGVADDGVPVGIPAPRMRASLREIKDLRDIPRLNKALVTDMERIFSHDIPQLLDAASRPGGPAARPVAFP